MGDAEVTELGARVDASANMRPTFMRVGNRVSSIAAMGDPQCMCFGGTDFTQSDFMGNSVCDHRSTPLPLVKLRPYALEATVGRGASMDTIATFACEVPDACLVNPRTRSPNALPDST